MRPNNLKEGLWLIKEEAGTAIQKVMQKPDGKVAVTLATPSNTHALVAKAAKPAVAPTVNNLLTI